MKTRKIVLFLMTNFMLLDSIKCFDDEKCEMQLKKFDKSLEKRESWAVRCKFFNIYFSILFDQYSLKFSICGQTCRPEFFTETLTVQVISQNASSFGTMTSKDNTA